MNVALPDLDIDVADGQKPLNSLVRPRVSIIGFSGVGLSAMSAGPAAALAPVPEALASHAPAFRVEQGRSCNRAG